MCSFCNKASPKDAFCCERAELEALRSVVDETSRILDSEVVMAQSVGSRDAVEPIMHARNRLREVRRPTAA